MTNPTTIRRRAVRTAVVAVLVVLTGCGQQGPETVALTAADRSAVNTCAHAAAVVQRALDTVAGAEKRAIRPAAAGARLTKINKSLQAAAESAADDVVQQAVQDLVDSVTAYLAVLPDRTIGAYADAEADVTGRLAGFRRTCPVVNAGFDVGAAGWTATSGTSEVTGANTGQAGTRGLDLTNVGDKPSAIGVTDSPNWVDRTWRGTYRAGLWARTQVGTPTLTLVVHEKSAGAVVGEARASVRLGPDWTFVGVSYDATGRGGPLDIRVTVNEVPATVAVHVDGFAVARG